MSLVWRTNGKWAAPKSPMWESGDEAWAEDESASSNGFREGNDALHVIGYGPGDEISLPWTCARKCVRPGGAAVPKRPFVTARRGVRENKEGTSARSPFELSWLAWFFQLCDSLNIVACGRGLSFILLCLLVV